MASPWAFGNTTVRNPLRIQGGLAALQNSALNGYLIGKEQERRFAELLDQAGVIEIKDRTRDYSDMGRKWRSCFSQLGFITHKFYRVTMPGETEPDILRAAAALPDGELSGLPYEITPSGLRLIGARSLPQQQECMLRALLAYEIPSPIEKRNGTEAFKPLFFVLQTLTELLGRSGRGFSDVEMGMLQGCRTHRTEGVREIVDSILAYRDRLAQVQGTVAKRAVSREALQPIAESMGIQVESLRDYADSNFRYLRSTGLFSYQGRRLVFNEAKTAVIQTILQAGPGFAAGETDYLVHLWYGSSLPTDDEANALAEIGHYRELLLAANADLSGLSLPEGGESVADLNQIRLALEETYQRQRELRYAGEQALEPNLSEIIAYLKKLDNQKDEEAKSIEKIDDKAAYLEWAVWRAFLAVDSLHNPPYEARRFRVDQDFYPIGCAPGRGPDMLFLFEDFALVVEVTLTSSSRQEAAEGEPVRRHVAVEQKRIFEELGIPVYGLFLAGTIDNNTAETFRIGVWYDGDEPEFINIVPFTLGQFVEIMMAFRRRRFSIGALRQLLDTCLIPRNAHAPAWKREIDKRVAAFLRHVHR